MLGLGSLIQADDDHDEMARGFKNKNETKFNNKLELELLKKGLPTFLLFLNRFKLRDSEGAKGLNNMDSNKVLVLYSMKSSKKILKSSRFTNQVQPPFINWQSHICHQAVMAAGEGRAGS